MAKIITVYDAVNIIKNCKSIMVGGFLANGAPDNIIDEILVQGVKDLYLITSDTATEDTGVGKLITAKRCKKLLATHIGTNKQTGKQMIDGDLDVTLIPQGTFSQRIKCGGSGIGGYLTRVGFGTVVAEGKRIIEVDGIEYLLELPIKADIAIIKAYKVDKFGNVFYKGTQKNFNMAIATAADIVIVEAENIVEALDPECVHTQGVYIDYIVEAK